MVLTATPWVSVLMKIGEMMLFLTNWPKGWGGQLLLLRMTCGDVSNGSTSVSDTVDACAGRTRLHSCKSSWGELMWLIILIN